MKHIVRINKYGYTEKNPDIPKYFFDSSIRTVGLRNHKQV